MLNPDHHLPAELRSEYRELKGKVGRALDLDVEEAAALAGQVLEMAREVDKEYWKWEESV